ncbi:hypothetical protein [Lysinibacillus varians]|uniref:Uncharacterized protein n=1 Tax=Lysinibacillus varians TaxID=1145276 RepID=A0ABY2T9T6_9BACI|nr:hypothetical protein [Lysinibacillus varians]AHN23911.1 hypothetical protein T479_01525 [Lysinibacillus varians]TKI63044.1 hypothetical protein FC752_12125 [Lysinibacillus varians]
MKGSFHQSRRQSNFYNYLKPDKQLAYAKQWVATLNSKLLEPFVKITGATKYNRDVFYEIDIEKLLKVEKENQLLREALESAQSQLISIRGLDRVHDSEITGVCSEIRKTLEGGEI